MEPSESEEASQTLQLAPSTAVAGELKFGPSEGFYLELRDRVARYFAESGRRPRDCPQMYVKSAIILGWLLGSYLLLLVHAETWWLALPLAISLGLAMAGCGFNIQHDGGHQAYSEHKWMNKLAALTLDLLGGSSYVWARKHNAIHHSYGNITGHDDDINLGVFGRLSPHQKRLGFHRLQHIYLWILYGFLPFKWQFYGDFRHVLTGRIGDHRIVRPSGWNLIAFAGGKIIFFSLALAIPLVIHPWWIVLPCFLLASFIQGLVLSVVFQLAHCVDAAEFPMPHPDTGRMEAAWAVHQVNTTVNFACDSRLLPWFLGGLNFQIEHHLFPRVCHIHYPALSHIVRKTCEDFQLRYSTHDTLTAGVISHFRWLRQMGQNDQQTR